MRDAVALTALVVAAGSLSACSSSSTPSDAGVSDASEDGAAHEAGRESGLEASESAPADAPPMPYEAAIPPSLGGMRVANFAAAAPPIDFCFAPHGTTKWTGPMLAAAGPQAAGEYVDGSAPGFTFSDAGSTGLGFPGVTSYFYLAPGPYDARFVVAGSPDCTVPVVPDTTTLPALAANGLVTVALFSAAGDAGSAGLTVVGFVDDVSVPPASVVGAGRFAVRFINAAPTVPSAGFGTMPANPLGTRMYEPIFSGVGYRQASSPAETTAVAPFVDDNGYVFAAALVAGSSVNATVIEDYSPVSVAGSAASFAEGATVTAVLIVDSSGSSSNDAGVGSGGLQLLCCLDNAGVLGLSGACSVVAP
jgi:hypothetical protein